MSGATQVLLAQASGVEHPDSRPCQEATCPQLVVFTAGGSGRGWPDTRRSSTHTEWKVAWWEKATGQEQEARGKNVN